MLTVSKSKIESYIKTDVGYIFRGGSWLVLGQIVGAITGLLSLYLFTRLLPKEVFGTYKYVLSFIAVVSVLTLPGINGALTQAVARGFEGGISKILFLKLRWGLLASLASLGLAGYYFYSNNLFLSGSFVLMAVFIPSMNAFYLYRAVLSGKSLFKEASIYESITRVISVLVMVGAAFFTQNILILVAVYFVHYTIVRIVIYFLVKSKLNLNNDTDPLTISFGKHLSLMSIAGAVASQLDKILVFNYLGPVSLAIYVVAMSPVDQMRGLVGHLETLAFPKFANKTDDDLKNNLPRKILYLELLLLPVVLIYILLIPLVFIIFFPEYLEGIVYSQVLSVVLLFTPRTLITAALGAKMKTKELYWVRVAGPICRILLLLLLVSQFGLWGAVVGTIASEILLYLIYFKVFKKM